MWMTHASEGLLIAYVDGEIEGSAAAELRDHLAACEACAGELHELERLSVRAHRLLGAADVAPPMLRRGRPSARPALCRPAADWVVSDWEASPGPPAGAGAGGGGRGRRAGFARARGPVHHVHPAGATRTGRAGGRGRTACGAAAEAPVAAPEAMGMAIMPADGRVRVILHAPAGVVDVRVRLVDAARARVETTSDQPDMRLRSAAGRVEVMGLNAGELSIDIPRSVRAATVEVNGRTWVVKAGDQLQLAGPAGRTAARRSASASVTDGSVPGRAHASSHGARDCLRGRRCVIS
jgi:anti-sigma factor RsiW